MNGVDLNDLAEHEADLLGPHITRDEQGVAHIDFHDGRAATALNEATLRRDFGIHVVQPQDRLCPPIPNRLNYLLWLQDVLRHTREPVVEAAGATDEDGQPTKRRKLAGRSTSPQILDIGTGATAIYPLLGCAIDPHWVFTGTDIDAASLDNARKIVENPRNDGCDHGGDSSSMGSGRPGLRLMGDWPLNLASRITLVLRSEEDTLIPLGSQCGDAADAHHAHDNAQPMYTATMCNPPFYSSAQEMQDSLDKKSLPPNGACSGTSTEMICAGGEVAFVSRLIDESTSLRERVRWYTSMLGKMSSIAPLVDRLKQRDVQNYGVSAFVQGSTRRWVLIWSFAPYRLPDDLVRLRTPALLSSMPASNTITKVVELGGSSTRSVESIASDVRAYVNSLSGSGSSVVSSQEDEEEEELLLRFNSPSWSRAARRAAQNPNRPIDSKNGKERPMEQVEPVLCCAIRVSTASPDEKRSKNDPGRQEVALRIQWTYGRDRSYFESFTSSLLRKMAVTQ